MTSKSPTTFNSSSKCRSGGIEDRDDGRRRRSFSFSNTRTGVSSLRPQRMSSYGARTNPPSPRLSSPQPPSTIPSISHNNLHNDGDAAADVHVPTTTYNDSSIFTSSRQFIMTSLATTNNMINNVDNSHHHNYHQRVDASNIMSRLRASFLGRDDGGDNNDGDGGGDDDDNGDDDGNHSNGNDDERIRGPLDYVERQPGDETGRRRRQSLLYMSPTRRRRRSSSSSFRDKHNDKPTLNTTSTIGTTGSSSSGYITSSSETQQKYQQRSKSNKSGDDDKTVQSVVGDVLGQMPAIILIGIFHMVRQCVRSW
jgi:hypothetical protein